MNWFVPPRLWDPKIEEKIVKDRIGMNLLYVQVSSSLKCVFMLLYFFCKLPGFCWKLRTKLFLFVCAKKIDEDNCTFSVTLSKKLFHYKTTPG